MESVVLLALLIQEEDSG